MKQIRCANFAEVAEATLQQMGGPHVAVSGGSASPPIGPTLELLGRETTLERLAAANRYVQQQCND